MSDNREYPQMTYERLKQSHGEWRMLAMHNYSACVTEKDRADKAEAREQKLKEAIEKARERFRHGNVTMALIEGSMILADAMDSLYPKEATE